MSSQEPGLSVELEALRTKAILVIGHKVAQSPEQMVELDTRLGVVISPDDDDYPDEHAGIVSLELKDGQVLAYAFGGEGDDAEYELSLNQLSIEELVALADTI